MASSLFKAIKTGRKIITYFKCSGIEWYWTCNFVRSDCDRSSM